MTARLIFAFALLAAPALAQTNVVAGPEGARLDSIIRAAEAAGFHGSVLVSVRGRNVLVKGYGLAHPAAGTRFTPGTAVQIGSNTKDFTKVAIFQLLERGRLRLTDSLHRFFPALPADKGAITIRQLLDHRAGLPLGVAGDATALTRDDMLRQVGALTLASAPGTRERYSNVGYSLLAAIVEQLSGQSFDAYLDANVFRPAGMRETGLLIPRFDPANIAHGIEANGTDIGIILQMPRDAQGHLWSLRGNGGHLSTPADMQRFYRAVRGAALLREEAHRREVFNYEDPNVLAGSDLTSMFVFAWFPGPQAEVIIASNHASYYAQRLLPALRAAVGARDPEGDDPRAIVVEGPRERRPAAAGADRLPDTGVGRTIQAYLDAFNSGDTAVMRRFFETSATPNPNAPPMEARIARYQSMRANLGTLTLRGVRDADDGMGVAVDLESSSGERVTFTFDVEPDAPFRMRGLRVEVG